MYNIIYLKYGTFRGGPTSEGQNLESDLGYLKIK